MRSIPTRRGWAPFVGVALAALTAGSLITFSVIAQRTSLDGMSDERVIAASPAAVQPPSITIAPVADGEDASPTETGGTTPAAAFLTVVQAPSGPTTTSATDEGTTDESATDESATVAQPSTAARLGGPFAAEETFLARQAGGGRPRADGEGEDAGWDERHDGKHTHKSHDVKAKSKGSDREGSKKAKRSAPRGRCAHRGHGRGQPERASNSGSSHARASAAPAKRPSSSKARPAPAAKSSPSRPPAKGKSRGRGRGRH